MCAASWQFVEPFSGAFIFLQPLSFSAIFRTLSNPVRGNYKRMAFQRKYFRRLTYFIKAKGPQYRRTPR